MALRRKRKPAPERHHHVVRIATQGWAGSSAAETLDEVQTGVRCPWVEVDGHRFTAVMDAAVEITDDGFSRVTVSFLGPAVIVYLGPDGEFLGSFGEIAEDERFDYATARKAVR